MSFDLSMKIEEMPYVKVSYNLGGLLDVPTGRYEVGMYGENILNGGMGSITGVTGFGNNYKTTIMDWMMLVVMSQIPKSQGGIYDTEFNVVIPRVSALAAAIKEFNNEDIVRNGRLQFTDKSVYLGNEWYDKWKEFVKDKEKNIASVSLDTPFIDRDGKTLFKQAIPNINIIDSFSEFETQDAANIQDENELGSSGANTLYMRQGISKTRFMQDIPKYISKSNNPMLLSVQIGKKIEMDLRAAPAKILQYLKNGDVFKGAPPKFTFLTTNCWQAANASPLINDTTKAPEYPRTPEDALKGDTDLQIVTLINLRCKYGPSGLITQLIVSQQEGVQPTLTEFHYVKSMERYGMGGNMQNYFMELLPEVKLSRTVVRGKIDRDAKLRRAILITAEMCQMKWLWHTLKEGYLCTPKELYDDLKAKGYDWDILLATRSWWTYENDKHPIPFLSTFDLLNMRAGTYHPYWYPLLPGMKERPLNKGALKVAPDPVKK